MISLLKTNKVAELVAASLPTEKCDAAEYQKVARYSIKNNLSKGIVSIYISRCRGGNLFNPVQVDINYSQIDLEDGESLLPVVESAISGFREVTGIQFLCDPNEVEEGEICHCIYVKTNKDKTRGVIFIDKNKMYNGTE